MSLESNTFHANFEKFATSTVILVFNFIRTAPSLVERIFWLVVLLCSATLTVWDVSRTIEKFVAEPTASIVSFPVAANGFNFPNVTWCLPLKREPLLTQFDYKTLVDELVKTFSSKSSILEYFEKKLDAIEAEEDQLVKNYSLSSVNENVATASFASYNAEKRQRFTDDEIALIGLTSVLLAALVESEIPKIRGTQNVDFSPSLHKIYTLYASKGTNFTTLLRIVASLNCIILEVKLVAHHQDVSTGLTNISIANVCKRSNLLLMWFGAGFGTRTGTQQRICFRFVKAASPFVFQSPFDEVIITARAEAYYAGASISAYFPFDLPGLLNTERQAPLIPFFGMRQMVMFSLDTWSLAANLRRSRCLAKEDGRGNTVECANRCRDEFLENACKCSPLISTFLSFSRIPIKSCVGGDWNTRVYSRDEPCQAALTATAQETNASCSFQCYPNCETILFSSTITQQDAISSSMTNASTFVRFRSFQFVYQSVVELKTMDEKQLITSLGGNLSLYLGASFLAVIHILVFCVKLPFEIIGDRYCSAKGPRITSPLADAATTIRPRPAGNFDEIFDVIFDEFANLRRQQRRTDRRLDSFIGMYARDARFRGESHHF